MHAVKYTIALVLSAVAVWTYSSALQEVLDRNSTSLISRSYGGHLQFLTILSLASSLIHQSLSVLSLLTGLRSLNALQSWLLMITAPLEVVVALLYWPLKFYNDDLVKDKRFGIKLDPSLDRKLHMYPAIFEFLSATVLSQRAWRARVIGPLILFSSVAGGYWFWFEHTAKINGFYPYPLLSLLTLEQKVGLIMGATMLAFISFKAVQGVQRAVRK